MRCGFAGPPTTARELRSRGACSAASRRRPDDRQKRTSTSTPRVREYVAAGLDGDAQETDTHRAECLVLEGRAEEALALADAVPRTATGDDEVERDLARLERVRGYALLHLGQREAAHAAFTASLEAGRAREADYEVALSLLALAHIARLTEDEDRATKFEAEAGAILEPLGVRTVPDYAVPMSV